ncbi:MAG: HAMP domain-containing sensor histidine kinase [Intestinibacter bartlettii]|uniref:sensor histidine kinase n=1 Tax=Intestinibacter bartlettii TaxID=261299 RepID=UPI0026F04603|nr:HAMP domain-containing sensor histidine kinase [Intestinibacter bartlettii]MDO5010303.1 HAMP domain-containing sensor histidine kinase [Intestinibacter bartlettii]
MKFWKKIFLYSLILFLLLFNGGGIILIEKIHGENLNTAIKSLMYKYLNVQSVMYLNSDYLTNIDVDSESNMKNWMDIIINGYSINNVEQYNTELYSMENKEITSDLKQKILGKRQEILQAQTGKKVFIIRSINNKKYAFVSSIVNLENRDFKLIISRDIQYVYTERINNYKLFILIDFIILIILSIGMYIISKKLTNPIVNLSNISKDIAKGEYDIRVVESKKNDEIGVLEHNFNLMIDVIENNIEELKTLNESKQRFIDSLNHEIKTPITSIIGYSELLLKGNVSEEIKIKAYKYINSEAKRLETLNSTLLKLTLIREEKKTLKKVNLIEMINGVENILKYKLLKKDIYVNIKIEDVNILADKELLEVLLTNLIDNSIKASSENSIIEIDGYYNNEKYILKIKDYGIGIPKEDLDKILEPFYMVDKARTRKNNGIGLGLSICSEICKIHNISLDIESELNMGTIVILGFDKENFYNEI